MKEFLILYILFGIGLTCSSRTNLMHGEKWYMQLLHVVAYPVIIFYTVVRLSWLIVKLTKVMDEQKNTEIDILQRLKDLDKQVFPVPSPIIPVDVYSKHWNGDDEIFKIKDQGKLITEFQGFDGAKAFNQPVDDEYDIFDIRIGSLITFDDYSMEAFLVNKIKAVRPQGSISTEYYMVEGIGGKNGTWINPFGLVNGIPITPEVLDALSIVDVYTSDRAIIYTIPYKEELINIVFDPERGNALDYVSYGNIEHKHIQFVHQLQNFYHGVTGIKMPITEGHRKEVSQVLFFAEQNPMHNVEKTN